MPLRVVPTSSGVRFAIKVVPGASRDRVMGLLGDALKVAVSKPPSGGAANEAVIELLANTLGVRESQVTIVAGHTNPRKEIEVNGVTTEQLLAQFT
jgi:uncharacterized protein (TIGR00251 family)